MAEKEIKDNLQEQNGDEVVETKDEIVDFEEYGMEAVRKIKIKNFPAFIITDDKGNDFFEQL